MRGKKQIEKQIEKQAIRRIVQRNFKKKRMENMVLILSILLVTVLMTVMFGAGISLFHNLELANLRMKGTEANVIIPHMEEEEMERFGRIEEISSIGRQQFVAAAVMQEGMSDSQVFAMTAYDKTEWETHIVPTLSDIQGTYPQNENEIMMSRWMLGQLEIDEPKIGMRIPVSFVDLAGEEKEQTFILSGYYVDYINYAPNITPNSANTISANLYYTEQGSTKKAIGNMAVSQEFAERYGTAEGLYGTARRQPGYRGSLCIDRGSDGPAGYYCDGIIENPGAVFRLGGDSCIIRCSDHDCGISFDLQCDQYFCSSGNAYVWAVKDAGCHFEAVELHCKKTE